jgi:hypothetical protein
MIAALLLSGELAITALGELRVPAERLPAGCALSSSASVRESDNRVRGGLWASLPISSNPATSSEPRLIVEIRQRIEGLRTTPDPPALSARGLARFQIQLADGIDESYAAIFLPSDSTELVVVYGLRFAETLAATEFWSTAAAAKNPRFTALTSGTIVAVATGPRGACLDAVASHVKSLRE